MFRQSTHRFYYSIAIWHTRHSSFIANKFNSGSTYLLPPPPDSSRKGLPLCSQIKGSNNTHTPKTTKKKIYMQTTQININIMLKENKITWWTFRLFPTEQIFLYNTQKWYKLFVAVLFLFVYRRSRVLISPPNLNLVPCNIERKVEVEEGIYGEEAERLWYREEA